VPSSPGYTRDYKREAQIESPKAKKDRIKRVLARRKAIKEGRVAKHSTQQIDHKKPLRSGGSNAKSNQRVVSRSKNTSDNGQHPGKKQNRKRK